MAADHLGGSDSAARFRLLHFLVVCLLFLWAGLILALALFADLGLDHGVTEALIPVGFVITAVWAWPERWQQVGLATAGLCASYIVTLHLTEGAWLSHALLFPLALLLVVYGMPITNLFLGINVVVVHVVVAAVDSHAIYGHGWSLSSKFLLVLAEVVWLAAIAAFQVYERQHRQTATRWPDEPEQGR